MRILITGSPGTGKTSVSKLLAKELDLELINVKKIALGIKNKKSEVDVRKLKKIILTKIKKKKRFIIENHLLCEFRLPVNFIFVLRCRPDILRRRLIKRKYSNKKVEENVLAEMLDYCTQNVVNNYKLKPVEIETSKKRSTQIVKKIISVINGKTTGDKVDYSKYLINYARKGI
ncbi:AAA family ATPase [Candidatus Micrarchaeota archaeon]|nr:AAA family ATPase [Candidatus Micrarchaeota archaeon]